MTGKVFAESGNIYQDQAKILFNYYSTAAEKIVQEEERIEGEIAVLEAEKRTLETEKGNLWKWFLTIILFFMYFIKKSELDKQIMQIDARINEFKRQHQMIFRDYNVSKLGVAYVPVADQIRYDDKSFIVDYTGRVDESELTLQMSRQNDLMVKTIGELEELATKAPVVESSEDMEIVETDDYSTSIQEVNEYDYFGKLDRSLKTLSFCMDDVDSSSVSLPLVPEKSEYREFLKEYATDDIPADAPIIPIFDTEKYAGSVNKFQELNKMKDSLSSQTEQFEDVLKGLMVTIANSVQAISALKVASTDKVIANSNKVLYQILKAPYNHYSPMLEHEEIDRIRNERFDYTEDVQGYEPFQLKQSSRVKYNLHTGTWCAEDGSTTTMPFGVHQIYEEIVAPVVQNLMAETRVERLKIYNHIKDQKMHYLNEWHKDTQAFYIASKAESADIINLMQNSLQEYVAAYNTLISLQRTEENMTQSDDSLDSTVVKQVDNSAESLAAFEMQSKEFEQIQTDFEDYMERLKDDIDQKAERFGHIEYYDAKLRDGYSNEAAIAASEVNALDERRKPLASVNPLFAKNSELLPTPDVSDITYEHISLNLPIAVKNALEELGSGEVQPRQMSRKSKAAVLDQMEDEPMSNISAEQPSDPQAYDGSDETQLAESNQAESVEDLMESELSMNEAQNVEPFEGNDASIAKPTLDAATNESTIELAENSAEEQIEEPIEEEKIAMEQEIESEQPIVEEESQPTSEPRESGFRREMRIKLNSLPDAAIVQVLTQIGIQANLQNLDREWATEVILDNLCKPDNE